MADIPLSELSPGTVPEAVTRDTTVDRQYIKKKSPTADYVLEPWRHCEDLTKSFLSIRKHQKSEFLEKLEQEPDEGPKKKDRIISEINRIEKVRKRFETTPRLKASIDSLNKLREKWRAAVAVANIPTGQSTKCQKRGQRPSPSDRTRSDGRQQSQTAIPRTIPEAEPEPEPYYGFQAYAMYFQKAGDDQWRGHSNRTNPRYNGTQFPNQKISVQEILEDTKDNPLMEKCRDDEFRYFHFPANNMRWIEEAMFRYYSVSPGDIDDSKAFSNMGSMKAERILAREFWSGQMHGSGGKDRTQQDETEQGSDAAHKDTIRSSAPVHSRHMRSRVSLIPRDPPTDDANASLSCQATGPNHIRKSPSMTAPSLEKNVALFLPYLHWETSSRRAKMVAAVKEETGTNAAEPKSGSKSSRFGGKRLFQVTNKAMANKDIVKEDSRPKPLEPKHNLGKYLMQVAKVADHMDYEADERLLRDNVNKNPPLHIRRTLDQYYFLTLDDTSQRDRDQVVYRGTQVRKSSLKSENTRDVMVSKNTRVVMVDQLWLWILDDNTIITSFPRRWGRNKPDRSGVHKSLRERLETKRDVIKSVHHLALIIIDQCSRVFFDRTKPLDERPEVMDLFASAIGNVTDMTAIAFDNFWHYTDMHSNDFLPGSNESTNHRYLNINPEGILLQEAQDVAEELKIMKRIYNEQKKVVKDFQRHIVSPLGKPKKITKDDGVALVQKLLDGIDALRSKGNTPKSHDADEKSEKEVAPFEETVHEAEALLDLIESRQDEIQDLEESAMRTCVQLEGLLSLKQQQASIVEAKAALRRADESVRQGRAVMAFTIVTIFFLPLGFFAAFFGMNNQEINQSSWMSLPEQIGIMFGLSAVIIFLSVSLAFSGWSRAMMQLIFRMPIEFLAVHTGLQESWHNSRLNLERRRTKILGEAKEQRDKKKKAREEQEKKAREDEEKKAREDEEKKKTRLEQEAAAENKNIGDGKTHDENWSSESSDRPAMAANGSFLRRKLGLNGNGKVKEPANEHLV